MASSNRKRPNILIFMMDTQGTRNMSCYGYRRKTTPFIDEIAEQGAIFLNHFVNGPWTLPVHASMFTGRYSSSHGAGASHEGLEPGLPQMPEIFTRNGYRSVAFCYNHWACDTSPVSAGVGFESTIKYADGEKKPWPPCDPELDRGSLKGVQMAEKWIDDNIVGTDDPFLMFINCEETHDPYLPAEPFRSRFILDNTRYEDIVANRGDQKHSTYGERCQTLDEWMAERSLYDGCTACLDDRIGRLTRALRERGMYDDTIVIVTGDHGDVQGEQVWYSYHSQNGLWDRVLQTPLVIRYPRGLKAGTRCNELVQIVDLFPALLELSGITDEAAEKSIQGISLLKAIRGPVREFVLGETQRGMHPMRGAWCTVKNPEDFDPRYMNVWYKSARTMQYKYIWVSNGNDMLFDIVRDPDERFNIISQHPEIARDLRHKMEKMLLGMEQRYFQDRFKKPERYNPLQLRRLAAWGLYQPEGVVPPWDDTVLANWKNRKRRG